MFGLGNLKDKIVVITGATGLIGESLCKGFVANEAKVIIAARNADKGNALANDLQKNGYKAYFHPLDISVERSVDSFIQEIKAQYGKIDIWINNAFPRTSEWNINVEKVSYDSVKQNMELHLAGYFLCSQKVCEIMKESGAGNIINVSSIYGVVGPHFSIYEDTKMTCAPAYPLIKGGIITMTKYFATYFAKNNIRVNCICPGGVYDHQDEIFVRNYEKQVPLGRMAKPEEMVGAALFLASDMSSYITGHCLMVDGGWTAW